jgi:hypothetical protein
MPSTGVPLTRCPLPGSCKPLLSCHHHENSQGSLGARLVSRQAKKKGPHSHRRREGQWTGRDRGCFVSGHSEKSRSGQGHYREDSNLLYAHIVLCVEYVDRTLLGTSFIGKWKMKIQTLLLRTYSSKYLS